MAVAIASLSKPEAPPGSISVVDSPIPSTGKPVEVGEAFLLMPERPLINSPILSVEFPVSTLEL